MLKRFGNRMASTDFRDLLKKQKKSRPLIVTCIKKVWTCFDRKLARMIELVENMGPKDGNAQRRKQQLQRSMARSKKLTAIWHIQTQAMRPCSRNSRKTKGSFDCWPVEITILSIMFLVAEELHLHPILNKQRTS